MNKFPYNIAYMQFLAAMSRCTTLLLAKYSIPLATCKQISINLQETDTYNKMIYQYYQLRSMYSINPACHGELIDHLLPSANAKNTASNQTSLSH